ncbi:unnamed protein product [Mytilus coruscus]|uniref:Ig-like domain-containing protein n=1 Tax=Mytilus coruscus TaxID=42192 RepID=A0A6J8D0L2_MYTCO|nr:unnamed protein product [Mytilus coruscus]
MKNYPSARASDVEELIGNQADHAIRYHVINMWLILTFCVLSQVISVTASSDAVTWHVSSKKVEFGNNVTLKCIVHNEYRSILRALNHPTWEVKGLKQVKCQGGSCSDANKYSMTIHAHVSCFALIIHNFSETDLNVNYSCSYGFTKITNNLTEDHISILKKPAENSIIDNTAVEKGRLNINITVAEVYPVPLCSVTITKSKKQVISEVTLNVTVFDISKYQKKVEVLGFIDSGLEQCERQIKVDCCLHDTLVNLLKRNIPLCRGNYTIIPDAMDLRKKPRLDYKQMNDGEIADRKEIIKKRKVLPALYDVERIISVKNGSKECTWEPLQHLPEEVIEEFNNPTVTEESIDFHSKLFEEVIRKRLKSSNEVFSVTFPSELYRFVFGTTSEKLAEKEDFGRLNLREHWDKTFRNNGVGIGLKFPSELLDVRCYDIKLSKLDEKKLELEKKCRVLSEKLSNENEMANIISEQNLDIYALQEKNSYLANYIQKLETQLPNVQTERDIDIQ